MPILLVVRAQHRHKLIGQLEHNIDHLSLKGHKFQALHHMIVIPLNACVQLLPHWALALVFLELDHSLEAAGHFQRPRPQLFRRAEAKFWSSCLLASFNQQQLGATINDLEI